MSLSVTLHQTTGAFAQLGCPDARRNGTAHRVHRAFGGVALIVGLFTCVAALLLACDMFSAILLAHAAGGFFLPVGLEFVLMLFGSALTLLFADPGVLSLDGVLAKRSTSSR